MLILFDKNVTHYDNLGIGVLNDFKSDPIITEVLNGLYTLEFDYILGGIYAEHLIQENIIKSNVSDGTEQLFRISNIKKDDAKITILAKHIFFDLSKNFLVDVAPTDKTANQAIEWILNHAETPTNYDIRGNCDKLASTRYVRKNIIDAIYNEDNAILKRYGGELELDNYNITCHKKRGSNSNIVIREGKNINGIEFNLDFTTVATRVIPQGSNELLLPEKFIDSPLIGNYSTPIFNKVDLNIGVGEDITEDEALQMMRDTVKEMYLNGLDKPTVSIRINLIELSKVKEYENYSNLEKILLGDTIVAKVERLNIDITARVVKTVYNCNLNRLINIEIGSIIPNIATSQINTANEIKKLDPSSFLQEAMNYSKKVLDDFAKKGFKYETENETYYLDKLPIEQAKYVRRDNLGGTSFSENGVNGPFSLAWDIKGNLNAGFITVGTLQGIKLIGNEIEGGSIFTSGSYADTLIKNGSIKFTYANSTELELRAQANITPAGQTDIGNLWTSGNFSVVGQVTAKNYVTASDKRLKENIKDIDVSFIDDLKIKAFDLKNGNKNNIGLIAQDYLEMDYNKYFLDEFYEFKENKKTGKETKKAYYNINYQNITNALIKYCQELNQKVLALEKELKK